MRTLNKTVNKTPLQIRKQQHDENIHNHLIHWLLPHINLYAGFGKGKSDTGITSDLGKGDFFCNDAILYFGADKILFNSEQGHYLRKYWPRIRYVYQA